MPPIAVKIADRHRRGAGKQLSVRRHDGNGSEGQPGANVPHIRSGRDRDGGTTEHLGARGQGDQISVPVAGEIGHDGGVHGIDPLAVWAGCEVHRARHWIVDVDASNGGEDGSGKVATTSLRRLNIRPTAVLELPCAPFTPPPATPHGTVCVKARVESAEYRIAAAV